VPAIKGAIAPILWEKLGYLPADQDIIFYIFNISQMDMASRRSIVSTRETERIYDSLVWKEVGESCQFGLMVRNGCHEDMAKFIRDNFRNKLNDRKDVTSNGRIGIIWECHILPPEILLLSLSSLSSMARCVGLR
jgi:hypothetical protein